MRFSKYRPVREHKINSALARRLAQIYEDMVGPFPGGVENAYIDRLRPGYWQRRHGAWSWTLGQLERKENMTLASFGSQWSASEAADDPDVYIVVE